MKFYHGYLIFRHALLSEYWELPAYYSALNGDTKNIGAVSPIRSRKNVVFRRPLFVLVFVINVSMQFVPPKISTAGFLSVYLWYIRAINFFISKYHAYPSRY